MAGSNEWTERHLTPRGWEEGDSKTDFSPVVPGPTPADRVMTVTFTETCSGYGPVHRAAKTEWCSDNDELVQELLSKFGAAPDSL